MIDLKYAFWSMIDRSGFDRSDGSFSRIVWPLVFKVFNYLFRLWLKLISGFEIKGSGGAKCSQIEPKCS